MTYAVTNQGIGGIYSKDWLDRVYFSTNEVWDAADTLLSTVYKTGSLPSGGTYSQTNTVTLPNVSGGTYYLLLKVDDAQSSYVVEESVETNNVLAIPVAVGLSSLTVSNGSGSGIYTNGQQVAITADALVGKTFVQWIGDTQYVNNVTYTNAVVTMSTNNVSLTATFTEQTTANGTPYWWLAQYGLTNYEADAVLDQDSDGMQTWQEYIAGTDPTNSNSVLKLTDFVLSGERMKISWPGVQNRAYTFQYQYADSLKTNNWQSAPDEISGEGAVISLTNSLEDVSNAFYRVKARIDDSSVASVNMLGCTKIVVPSNQMVLVSLGFNNASNTINGLFGNFSIGSKVYTWDMSAQSYTIATKTRTGWGTSGTNRIQRGVGAFLLSPRQTNVLLSGSVPTEGTTTVYKVNGYALLSYPYPVRTAFTNTALAKTAAIGDSLSIWLTNWIAYTKIRTGWGSATNLQINPGQGFFFQSTTNRSIDEIRPYVIE